MTHDAADLWEQFHHLLYATIRGNVYPNQYVGTVKMGEEELEKDLFHPTNARYNWLAYWKKHAKDDRDSEGSWKLRHPRHKEYVGKGKQVHITLFQSKFYDGGIDVYAHYEYDNIKHPWKHYHEHEFSAAKGVNRARQYFTDNGIDIYDLR